MGHYYNTKGESRYQVPKKDGKGMKDTTITDARKLNLVPSVTTVTSVLGKPALTQWFQLQLLDIVEQYPNMVGGDGKWKQKLIAMSQKENSKYAEKGNEIHDKLEQYYTDYTLHEDDVELLHPVIDLIKEKFGEYAEIIPEQSFAHPDGYGGKIDLIIRNGEGTHVLDFKTKHSDKLGSNMCYDDYLMQIAAYRKAVDTEANCYNLLISVTNPGLIYLHKWEEEQLVRGTEMFDLLLQFWKLSNNYDSSFTKGEKEC